ncbi:hypothetical protein [Ruminiclostridium cellobioparum]|uniref:hypothetical protein n=1 Tax=Ruminiclostridium cellobioparum TaxID=29355 RepID=UPI001A9A3806|nr:hypothetical protein [Ruminiclostridium cellobioparum]
MKLQYQISVSKEEPLPYSQRPDRFIIHGVGWGMGTYRSKIPQLRRRGLSLDIVACELQEARTVHPETDVLWLIPTGVPGIKTKKVYLNFLP